jgi:hypothetical protein
MAGKLEGYTVSVDGPDHKFKRSIDEVIAIQILNLVTTGALPTGGLGGNGAAGSNSTGGGGLRSALAGSDAASGQTVKQFIASKRPETQYERVACLAYYLTHVDNTPQFKTRNITKANTAAAQPKLSNPSQVVADATKTYKYLSSAGKGAKQITSLGEAVVDALPTREAVAAAIVDHKPTTRRKRVAKKKK